MKRMIYQVCVGKRSTLYNHCVESVAQYCKAHNIEHIVQKSPILMIKPDVFATNRSKESYEKHGGYLPIFEKENAFTYLPKYDQVAIIDADIWIRPGAPNIFDDLPDDVDAGFVCEREMPITEEYKRKIIGYSKMQYGTLRSIDWKWNASGGEFFNMGMMVLNSKAILKYLKGETPNQFLRRPDFKPFIDGMGNWKWSTDQTLLNVWVKEEKMNVAHMNFKWNALFNAIPENKVKEAHFVHFFLKDKLPYKGENIEELIKAVE